MASAVEALLAKRGTTTTEATRPTIAAFVPDVHNHKFTKVTGRDAKGRAVKEATGEEKLVYRVLPVDSEGKKSGVGIWAWLDGASALAALIAYLRDPASLTDAVETYEAFATDLGWPALPKAAAPKAEAPAPAPKPQTAVEKLMAKKAAVAKESDGLDDLPF